MSTCVFIVSFSESDLGMEEDGPVCVGPEWGWGQGSRTTETLKKSVDQNRECRDGACGLTSTKLANL